MRPPVTFTVLCFTLIVAACDDAIQAPKPAAPTMALDRNVVARADPEALSGGATTVFDSGPGAFGHPAPNLDAASLARHIAGDSAFSLEFVATPGQPNSGLGPLFNNTACEACHMGDGRGRPPNPGEQFASMLFRASIPGPGPNGGPNPAGLFGGQLQLLAIPGFTPEASASVTYVDSSGQYADGTTYSLRVPRYSFSGIIAPLPSNLLTSPRVAPVNFGLGLLEAVPPSTILGLAALEALNRDGVSGHPNVVYDVPLQQYVIGRFGWKANVGTLLHQAAGAFNGDMGITSEYFPHENCLGEFPGCADHPPEITTKTAADVAFYTQTLGVPARRHLDDPQVRQGEFLFSAIGCNACHVTTLQTGVLAGVPAVSNQRIHPYTDLLVHDMGAALADNRPDFRAGGREFRTPPLWGIGLVQVVNGHTFFLHDGRARNLLEAVLWHGGEATRSRQRFTSLSSNARTALIAFLNSL
jgi:CxxC motif-containing protein (DUF1111 family)